MTAKSIKTIAGLQRLHDARNRRRAKLYRQPYILQPAVARYLGHFEGLQTIHDARERYQAFRRTPSLEHELEAVDTSLSPRQRVSLAQQDRAQKIRSRVTTDGQHLEQLILKVLGIDPWAKKAKQYWEPFIEYLKTIGLAPVLSNCPRGPTAEQLEYGRPGHRRRLSLRQFENHMCLIRKRFLPTKH